MDLAKYEEGWRLISESGVKIVSIDLEDVRERYPRLTLEEANAVVEHVGEHDYIWDKFNGEVDEAVTDLGFDNSREGEKDEDDD
jgi:hypothetical protein